MLDGAVVTFPNRNLEILGKCYVRTLCVLCMMMAFEIDENFTKINMALVLRVRTMYAHTFNSWHNQPEPIGVITFCGENIIRLLLIDI